jgi:hypothetical protein
MRQSACDLVHDLNDFPHDITAVATGGMINFAAAAPRFSKAWSLA